MTDLPSKAQPDRRLPRGVYRYVVDVLPRDLPRLEINGNEAGGSYRDVTLFVSHPDAYKDHRDIADLTVWGDVDPNGNARIGLSSVASRPFPFMSSIPIVLSAGAGTKTINVRVRFLSGRYVEESVEYVLAADVPHICLLRQPPRQFIPSTETITLQWSCSHAVTHVYACLADSFDLARSECTQITAGTNVDQAGTWAAGELITTSFTYAQALASSASMPFGLDVLGQSFVKLFAVTALGETT